MTFTLLASLFSVRVHVRPLDPNGWSPPRSWGVRRDLHPRALLCGALIAVTPEHRERGVTRETRVAERELTPDEGGALRRLDRARVNAGGAQPGARVGVFV